MAGCASPSRTRPERFRSDLERAGLHQAVRLPRGGRSPEPTRNRKVGEIAWCTCRDEEELAYHGQSRAGGANTGRNAWPLRE
jgi:hypothetical protein